MTDPTLARSAWRRQVQRHWGWVMVLLVLAVVAAARIRLRDFPLERDEGEYAYAGQLILQGIPPYKLAYNMKFPGTYAGYALIMAVFGQSPAGIHLGVTCVTTLTALMIYWFGRRLLDEVTGVVGATAYAVLAASPTMLGLAGHATHFAALFATAGLCLLWPIAGVFPRWLRAGAAGLMFGLAVLMKQHAVFFSIWGAVVLAAAGGRKYQVSWKRRWRALASFSVGLTLPLALTCLVLRQAGVFEQFWFWTISYAREYASQTSLREGLRLLGFHGKDVVARSSLLWLLAGAGIGCVWFARRLRNLRLMFSGLLLAAALTTVPGFFFRPHYFLLTLPAAALSAAFAVHVAVRPQRQADAIQAARAWPIWAYIAILAGTIFQYRDYWFVFTPVQASCECYPEHPFPEAEWVAAFVRTNSAPDARVAVLGSEPEIYFLSRRRSATGYIYTYPLTEIQPFARQMQLEMIGEIESAKPEIVVLSTIYTSWAWKHESDRKIIEWWLESYQTNYEAALQYFFPRVPVKRSIVIYLRKKPEASSPE